MMRRIASVELLKLRTVGTLSRFAILTAALVLVGTFNAMASADFDRPTPATSGKGFRLLGEPAPDVRVSNRDDARAVTLAWTLVPLVVLALGIVAGASSVSTARCPARCSPCRGAARLVLGKVLAVAPVAVVLTLAGLAIDLAVALPWLHGKGVSVELGATTWLLVVAGALLCALAATALGVAVGLLTPFPATGIVLAIGFVIVVEPIVASRAHVVAEFLPGYAMDAAMRGLSTIGHHDVLPQAAGALVLAAWTAALLAGATRWLVRRDLV